MHIEDLTIILASSTVKYNSWDGKMIYSLADQISNNIGFTEKQNTQCIRILRRYISELSKFMNTDIVTFINNPTYKLPFRTIAIDKKISIDLLDNTRIIKVEFPFTEVYVATFRANRVLTNATWEPNIKAWIFDLTELNIRFLMTFAENEHFQVDDEFRLLAVQTANILANMEDYTPMLISDQGIPKFKNTALTVPALDTTDILEAVFIARKCGITIWDDYISEYINSDVVDKVTADFLNIDIDKALRLNSSSVAIEKLADIVTNMIPCLIIVPGGSELAKLAMINSFLKRINVATADTSVMFRLSNKIGKTFNDYVKEEELNNPITETTKIVFVSGKIPKPVLQSGIQFNCVIDLGLGGVHYSIKEYTNTHQNLIYYAT